MTRIQWPDLMRIGLVHLRLTPDQFWGLTPAELIFIANGGVSGSKRMTRAGLDALVARFPDTGKEGTLDDAD